MSGFYKYSFTKRERDEGKHASIIQKGKMERSSALFVDSARLALGGLEIRNLVLWNERTGQMNALIINIGRRWDDPDGILKRVGLRVHCMRACVAVDMRWLEHA
jgi:hypothetical protein